MLAFATDFCNPGGGKEEEERNHTLPRGEKGGKKKEIDSYI